MKLKIFECFKLVFCGEKDGKGRKERQRSDKIILKRVRNDESDGEGLEIHQHCEAKALLFILIHFQ